jgi:PAS domain S-box-containing protein
MGGAVAVVSDQPIIGNCDVSKLEDRVRRLESILRRKVLENESLREALYNLQSEKPTDIPVDAEAAIRFSQNLSRERVHSKLAERLLQISVDYGHAERGLLVFIIGDKATIKAEAVAGAAGVRVRARDDAIGISSELPISILQHVVRTHELVMLDDASNDAVYGCDETVLFRKMRSTLALPIILQSKLIAILFLENNLTSNVFTPDLVAVLKYFALQAVTSFENAGLYAELEKKVAFFDVLPISAWTLKSNGTLELLNRAWLESTGHSLSYATPHSEAWMDAVHPDDRDAANRAFRRGIELGYDFSFETRSYSARDGSYRQHLHQAVAIRDREAEGVRFVGTTTDIEEHKRREEALRGTQSALARSTRLATLKAMTASLAHDLSQPLSGIWANADAGARMLALDSPDLVGVAESIKRTMRDAARANEIVQRLRAMFAETPPNSEAVNINNAVNEVVTLIAGELKRGGAVVQTSLSDRLPLVAGDKIQLQQVILNLLLNAIDAMISIGDRPRIIRVESICDDRAGGALVRVRDVGIGLDKTTVENLFKPFVTTKATGVGVGLSICRTIIKNHGGRISATANQSEPGACFSFFLPNLHEASEK